MLSPSLSSKNLASRSTLDPPIPGPISLTVINLSPPMGQAIHSVPEVLPGVRVDSRVVVTVAVVDVVGVGRLIV